MSDEERYEAIEMILRSRSDGVSWFDYFFDLITETCEGTGEPDEEGNFESCTCGLESMGGSGGTLDQCYEYSNNVAAGISPVMVARVIVALHENDYSDIDKINKILSWARHEIKWDDYFENREWENEEDEDS